MKILRITGLALTLGVAGLAAAPASADGYRAPAGPGRSNLPSIWQGFYGGFHLGWGEADPADGIVGGAQIGHNWQSGQIVWGLEADISAADISFKESFMGATVEASIDWMATFRGRVGFLVTPRVLAYGTAGFGIASGSASGNIPGAARITFSDTESDFVYGLGVEGKLTDSMSLRVEYLAFSDLDIDVVRAGLNFKLPY